MPVIEGASETNHGMWAAGIACTGVGTLVAFKLFNPKAYDVLKWPIGIVTVGGTGYKLVQLAQSRMCGGGREVPVRPNPAPSPTNPLTEIWAQDPTDFASSLSQEKILEKAQLIARSSDSRAVPFLQALAKKTNAPHKLADIAPETWEYVEESQRKAFAGLVTTFAALQKVKNDLPADPEELAQCIELVVSETQPTQHYYNLFGNEMSEALVRALPAIKKHRPTDFDTLKDKLYLHKPKYLPDLLNVDEAWGLDVAMNLPHHVLKGLAVELVSELYKKGDLQLKEHLAQSWSSKECYPKLVDTNLAFAVAAATKDPHLGEEWEGDLDPAVKLYNTGDAELKDKIVRSLIQRLDEVMDADDSMNLACRIVIVAGSGTPSARLAIKLYDRYPGLREWFERVFTRRIDDLVKEQAMDLATTFAKKKRTRYSLETAIALYGRDSALDDKLIDKFKSQIDELVKKNAMDFALAAAAADDSNFSLGTGITLFENGDDDLKAKLARHCRSTDINALVEAGAIPFALAAAKKASDQVLADLSQIATTELGDKDLGLMLKLQTPALVFHTTILERIGQLPANLGISTAIALAIGKRASQEDGDKYLEAIWKRFPHFVVNALDLLDEDRRKPYVEKVLQENSSAKDLATYLVEVCKVETDIAKKTLRALNQPLTKELLDAWPNDDLTLYTALVDLKPEERAPYVNHLIKRKDEGLKEVFAHAKRKKWDQALITTLQNACNSGDDTNDN